MSQLDSFPTEVFVGGAKPTLANVLSARFPELRRMICRDLNLRDRNSLRLTSRGINVGISSQDHLEPFADCFDAQCDAKIPRTLELESVYSNNLTTVTMMPCRQDASTSVIKICEGASVLRQASCHGAERAVCSFCSTAAYKIADPGNFRNRVLNFGVTPICESHPGLPDGFDGVVDCCCTGPARKDGEKKEEELCLCFECRVAYNLERIHAADDMARAFLYMKDNKKQAIPEYHPEIGINRKTMPTCPCGNAIYWSTRKLNLTQGMCVWCGALKMPSVETTPVEPFPAKDYADNAEDLLRYYKVLPGTSLSQPIRLINRRRLTALHRQIAQKGIPPPVIGGRNRFWSHTGLAVKDEPLDPLKRRYHERDRRERPNCLADRQKFNRDDHDGFLMNFRWPCIEVKRASTKRLFMEAARGTYEAWEDRLDDQEGWRATVIDREYVFPPADHNSYEREAWVIERLLQNRGVIRSPMT